MNETRTKPSPPAPKPAPGSTITPSSSIRRSANGRLGTPSGSAIQRYIEDPLADFVLRSELTPGGTVMVDRAPEGDERDVIIEIVAPKEVPTPVGVGAEGGSSDEQPAAPEVDASADGGETAEK